MSTLRTLYLPFEAALLNDLEKENFSIFPESFFIDTTRGAREDYRWLRPCIYQNFAIRLAKYERPSFVIEFEMEQEFLDSFNLFPIDGMGKYAWTYWVHLNDRDEWNTNLKSSLKIVESFSSR